MPYTMRTAVLFLLACCSSNCAMTSGFYIQQQQQKMTTTLTQFHVVSFNDFSGEIIGEATSEEGQELAQEFYDQLRRREEEEQEKRRRVERLEQALRNGNVGIPKRPTGMQQQQQQVPRVRQDVLDFEKEFRKWTGQTEDEQVTNSAGFFRGGSSVYSYPASGRGTAMNAIPGGAHTMEDDNAMSHGERAMLGVLPYLLALAVVLSLAMGSGAFEASIEYDVFQDPASSSTNSLTSATMTATSPFATAETTLQQHMNQILLRNNYHVMV